jgi:F0F1-type ATP synthase epsilon subunit
MADLLRFSVLTPGKTLLDVAEVSKVRMKLADGAWLSLYPRHAPLLAETLPGPVTYTTGAGEQAISLSESILQVAENNVTLFTGGELAASLAMPGEAAALEATDTDATHFDRLARALMRSLQALPTETLGDFEPGGGAA